MSVESEAEADAYYLINQLEINTDGNIVQGGGFRLKEFLQQVFRKAISKLKFEGDNAGSRFINKIIAYMRKSSIFNKWIAKLAALKNSMKFVKKNQVVIDKLKSSYMSNEDKLNTLVTMVVIETGNSTNTSTVIGAGIENVMITDEIQAKVAMTAGAAH